MVKSNSQSAADPETTEILSFNILKWNHVLSPLEIFMKKSLTVPDHIQ